MSAPRMPLLTREGYDRLVEEATGRVLEILGVVVEAMVDESGLVPGQIRLGRRERVLKVLDDIATGKLDVLLADPLLRPHGERLLRQFRRDVEAEGLVAEEAA